MNTQQITEINCTTGEVITRPMTEAEMEQVKIDAKDNLAKKAEAEAAATQKAALLARLGITADEAKLLLG